MWDKTGDFIVNAFIDATSFNLGLVTQQAGLPLLAAEVGGGGVNALSHGIIDTLQNYQMLSNNGQNYNSINAGFTFGSQLGSGSSGSSYLQLADSSNSNLFSVTDVTPGATIQDVQFVGRPAMIWRMWT